jgi:D-alanyl-D-alanine carboxypeptidase/D-alanyl-D-alanine-endopeptidase (penicillin-binding protein 4)
MSAVSLESGAGGGNGDRVSPRATVQLLQGMRRRADWPIFEAMLPVLGVDGTLATAVDRDSQAKGKVRAKTGTYIDENRVLGKMHLRAKSLAGVMTAQNGKDLTFAIFVNDVPVSKGVGGAREGRTIGRLCEIIHRDAR